MHEDGRFSLILHNLSGFERACWSGLHEVETVPELVPQSRGPQTPASYPAMFGFDTQENPGWTTKQPSLMDLTKLNMEALEAFPSENPAPKECGNENADGPQRAKDEFEVRRKLFFGK